MVAPPSSSSPPSSHEERRLEILRRAAEVFRAKGYHGAGMREIAEGLGLAPGALYYYFPGKLDLLAACQAYSMDRLLEGGRLVAKSGEAADVRLRQFMRHHLETVLDELGGSSVHVAVGELPPDRFGDILRQRDSYERIVRRVLRDGIREGLFRNVDTKVATTALLGALNWTVVWFRPEGKLTPQEIADDYADLFLEGLLIRSPGDGARTGTEDVLDDEGPETGRGDEGSTPEQGSNEDDHA